MFETLQQRQEFVKDIINFLSNKFDLSDTQIFIFGSFLTDKFVPNKSDIDIGIYSESEVKTIDIEYELDIYLNKIGIKHDIVRMTLNNKQLINIPIMTYGETLTSYESETMFSYLLNMIQKHGTDLINIYN